MRIYLDLNCFNRPFDDQSQPRVADETQSIDAILRRVADGDDELVWSAALTLENSEHPLADRRDEIERWSTFATVNIDDLESLRERAKELQADRLKAFDAVHVACAESSGSDRFLTCDDRLLRRAQQMSTRVQVQNPRDDASEVNDD